MRMIMVDYDGDDHYDGDDDIDDDDADDDDDDDDDDDGKLMLAPRCLFLPIGISYGQ